MTAFCKRCNTKTERTKSRNCKPCLAIYRKAYRAANADKLKAISLAYAAANRDKERARAAAWVAANPERHKANRRAYHENNKDKAKTQHRAWMAANPDKMNAYRLAWIKANPDKEIARAKAWRAANKETCCAYSANRRALKKAAHGTHTAADVQTIFTLQKGKCICCKVNITAGYHVDHIMPLSKGGSNDKYNLQLLCPTCNMSKSTKHPITFMQERGFLL